MKAIWLKVACAAVLALLAGCEEETTLYSQLEERQANAIIAAGRESMIGATLYMTCIMPTDGSLVPGTNSCMMCKKQIINAGIETVIIRDTPTEYRIVPVESWITEDDSLSGKFGY